MELDASIVFRELKKKGIQHLYHANTVATSCTFIEQGGLLSRGAVEQLGLYQTPQYSDKIDKQFGVWHDIFLDNNDLHQRFNNLNYYGPVLFKFSLELLKMPDLPPIWITKDNPIYWSKLDSPSNRYIQNVNELCELYNYGGWKEMLTLRFTNKIIPFEPFLEEIIIDDPTLTVDEINIVEVAIKYLENSANKVGNNLIKEKVRIRKCSPWCGCKNKYHNESIQNLKKLFLAKV